MWSRIAPALIIMIVASACAASDAQAPEALRVHATNSAQPWLARAYACAPTDTAVMLVSPHDADLILRVTEPRPLDGSAYKIGEDEILVVTHPEVSVGRLTLPQVSALFAGQLTNWSEVGGADQSVLVWAFSPDVDIQAYFDRNVLGGRPVSSNARLAVSAQDMSDGVGSTRGSIGILTRRWRAGNTREALAVASVPVLAVTDAPPQGPIAELIACMQARPE